MNTCINLQDDDIRVQKIGYNYTIVNRANFIITCTPEAMRKIVEKYNESVEADMKNSRFNKPRSSESTEH